MTRAFRLSAAAALLLLASTAASPQAAETPAPAGAAPPFFERVEVNVVNVEVWVADRRGNRVTGLTPNDFEILEDGKPVEISNFYTVEWAESMLATPKLDALAPAAPGAPAAAERRVPPDQQLSLVIFIDNAHLFPAHRKKLLEKLEIWVEDRVIEGDNLMLVTFDRQLRVVQPFTRDRWAIVDAIGKVRKMDALGPMREAQRRQTMSSISMLASTSALNPDLPQVDTAYDMVRSYVQSATSDLKHTAAALETAIRMVSGLPGRKSVLLISGGLEQRPGEELYQHLEDAFGVTQVRDQASAVSAVIEPSAEALQSDQTRLFKQVSRTANTNRVTLYTLDASGAGGGSMVGADHSSLDTGSGVAGRTNMEAMRSFNLVEPLITLAADTGGTSIVNTNNFDDALTSMAADFDSYYSLGYLSPHGGDGDFHKIEVRTVRPGLTLRYRTGYVDKPQVERVADRTLSSLLLDLESNPLAVSMEFGPPERQTRKRFVLPVLVRIPVANVTLLPNGDRREGKLQIFVVVKDDDGGISELHQQTYPVAIGGDQLAKALTQEIGYLAKLELRPGRPVVAVGVWDEISGTESFVQKRVLVGDAAAEARHGR